MHKAEIKQKKIHQMNFVIRRIDHLDKIELYNVKINSSFARLIVIIK